MNRRNRESCGRRNGRVYVVYPLILAMLGTIGLSACGKQEDTSAEVSLQIETAVRTNVENIYTAKGKIISGQESSMNVRASSGQDSVIIDEVYVSVGDNVKAGDVLYTIDTTQTERDLALKEQQQAISDQENAIAQSNNERAYADAQAASGEQYETGTRTLVRNADDTNEAISQQLTDQDKLQSYKDEETKTKATYDAWVSQVNSLQADYDSKLEHANDLSRQLQLKQLDIAGSSSSSTSAAAASSGTTGTGASSAGSSQEEELLNLTKESEKAQWSADDAKTALDKAKTSMSEAKTAYDNAKSKREEYENTVKSDQTATTKDVRTLEDSGTDVNQKNRQVLTDEQTKKNAIASQELQHQSDTLTNEAEIAKLKEKLENGQVVATMDGTVTAVNVVAGQTYTGTDGVVLDNLSKMKVSADIDEGHIADLKVGTKVRVKTDSTGDTELTGSVTFTSPTPTQETSNKSSSASSSTSSSSSNTQNTKTRATYKVEVTLDEPNDRLRIGMTASIDFIVASAENVIAVPTSCLIDDGNGNYFLNVVDAQSEGDMGDMDSAGSSDMADNANVSGNVNAEASNSLDDANAGASRSSGSAAAAGSGSSDGVTGTDGTAAGSVSEVMVTIGVADDYYTEITSGNIQEGEKIQGTVDSGSGDYTSMMDGIYSTR